MNYLKIVLQIIPYVVELVRAIKPKSKEKEEERADNTIKNS
jgi:hypothetical protein